MFSFMFVYMSFVVTMLAWPSCICLYLSFAPKKYKFAEEWEDTGDLPFAYVTFADIDDSHETGACIIDFVNWKIYPAPLY